MCRLIFFVKTKFSLHVIIKAICTDFSDAVEFYFGYYSFVDGSGEYITSVIICMLADQVDASGRCKLNATFAKEGKEFFVNFVLHCCDLVVFSFSRFKLSNLALFLNTRPTPCSNPVIFGHRLYNGDSSSIIG